jgi:hypothetical protein
MTDIQDAPFALYEARMRLSLRLQAGLPPRIRRGPKKRAAIF